MMIRLPAGEVMKNKHGALSIMDIEVQPSVLNLDKVNSSRVCDHGTVGATTLTLPTGTSTCKFRYVQRTF
eukprot:SAG31_NODE_1956_length_6817_cov_10.363501_2_plen_70_part_00